MENLILATLLALPLLYLIHTLSSLTQYYRLARRTSPLPILITPVTPLSIPWLILSPILTPLLTSLLPSSWTQWLPRTRFGWHQHPKHARLHATLSSSSSLSSPSNTTSGSDLFWHIHPTTLEVHIASPPAACEVMRRHKDFPKNPSLYSALDIFGPNVNSANGRLWERHRRITAPPFAEGVMERVWEEAGAQVDGWGASGRLDGVRRGHKVQEGCTRVALHVLMAAGFGQDCEFDGGKDTQIDQGHTMSYRDAVRTIVKNMGVMILVRMVERFWPGWLTWGVVRETITARDELGRYMREFVEREREGANEKGRDNLMRVLVRSADRERNGAGLGMTDEEVYGNMFMWIMAGHDTTANAMPFMVVLLAVEGRWQEWLAEEIDAVFTAGSGYAETFPRLIRCLAVMYETLRLYGPVPSLPRWTSSTSQPLTLNETQITIPPNTDVILNFAALHTHPAFWGADAEEFRPDRWIVDWKSSLLQPPPGYFVPWNDGPRVCPGKKFSQVEFVRVVAGLFAGGRRVRLVAEEGESEETARDRAVALLKAASVDFALKLQGSEKIGLEWYRKN